MVHPATTPRRRACPLRGPCCPLTPWSFRDPRRPSVHRCRAPLSGRPRHNHLLAALLPAEDQTAQSMPDASPTKVAPRPHQLVLRGVLARAGGRLPRLRRDLPLPVQQLLRGRRPPAPTSAPGAGDPSLRSRGRPLPRSSRCGGRAAPAGGARRRGRAGARAEPRAAAPGAARHGRQAPAVAPPVRPSARRPPAEDDPPPCGTRSRSGSRCGCGHDALSPSGSSTSRSTSRTVRSRGPRSGRSSRATCVSSELTAAGLELIRWETDTEGDYALFLSRPAAPGAA